MRAEVGVEKEHSKKNIPIKKKKQRTQERKDENNAEEKRGDE